MKQSVLRIVCFLIILTLVIDYTNSVFKVKYGDGIYDLTIFYELDNNTIDVLFLGSSHAFENFNTGTLWDEYGMSTYILAGSEQPMWNTYYYLKEALKTQTPKLIVLEAYKVIFSNDYSDNSRIIKNNYGLNWSIDKINSVMTSAPNNRWGDYFLECSQYHSRYSELSKADFLDYQGNPLYIDWKGFGCNMATTPLKCPDISAISEQSSLSEKTEEYYRATIELAKENHIPIIVVVSPYAGIKEEEQRLFNRAADIAEELGVPFENYNLKINEIGIDYSVDAADASHLNFRGNQKYTSYLGQYIIEQYDIPDHRGDKDYESWDRHADFIRQMISNQELVETTNVNVLFEKTKGKNYWAFISVDGNCNTSVPAVSSYMHSIGVFEEGASGIWFLDGGNRIWYSGSDVNELYKSTRSNDFHLNRIRNSDGTYLNSVIIDNSIHKIVQNGVNVVIFDTLTEKIVDSFALDADDGYALVR